MQQRATDADGKTSTVSLKLPYPWAEKSVIDICSRLRVIGKALAAGRDLKTATAVAEGASSQAHIKWDKIAKDFEQHLKSTGVGISDRTWKCDHSKPMRLALVQLLRLKTENADELITAVAQNYKLGSVSRKKATASVIRLLQYGMTKHNLNPLT